MVDDAELLALGRLVRRMRRDRDLSQEALATLAGVHANQISRLERAVGDCYATTLIGVLRAMDVPLLAAIRAYEREHGPPPA